MNGTMMNYPLTLTSLLERAGHFFPNVESFRASLINRFIATVTATSTIEPAPWLRDL